MTDRRNREVIHVRLDEHEVSYVEHRDDAGVVHQQLFGLAEQLQAGVAVQLHPGGFDQAIELGIYVPGVVGLGVKQQV